MVPFVNLGERKLLDRLCGESSGDEAVERTKRADARRNRAEILKAAEICFAEQGIGVPIDEIAKRAGVGVGTVYRHFPTKESLAEAVIFSRMEELAAEARALAESSDPGGALFSFLERLAKEGATKRDLVEALPGSHAEVKRRSESIREDLEGALQDLLKRAQDAGAIRSDIELADLFGLVMGTCQFAGESGCSQARMFAVVCDGLKAHGGESSPALSHASSQH
jgi:AcrR family transcriptional regulator